ncbi:MAG: lipid biosynthesis B12-binding/radical SAM protein [Elusimicrobiota bacterium]
MKILLISANVAITPYPVYPLGLSMIAGALKKAGHDVCQFDFLASGESLDTLKESIKKLAPQIIGISIRNIDNVNFLNTKQYMDAVKKIVETVRSQSKSPIILGGSGFSILPEIILRETAADYGVVGEGEKLIVEFAKNAEQGIYPGQKLLRGNYCQQGDDLSSALYDPQIMPFYLKRGNSGSVQSKRGCSQRCVYCTYPYLEGVSIRCRDPRAVVADIQLLIDTYQIKHLFFTDSVFNDREGNFRAVVKEMIKRNIFIPWTGFFQPVGINEEDIELMKRTGLKAVELGSDASTDTTLRRIGKHFLFKDIVAANDLFNQHNIAAAHYFMFGVPGETVETVREGIENIKSLARTVCFIFMGVRIFPGTPLAQLADREVMLSSGNNLLNPVYYISPGLEAQWLEKTLTLSFSGLRNCIFPPDSMERNISLLHEMGYSGPLWDMLIAASRGDRRKKSPSM